MGNSLDFGKIFGLGILLLLLCPWLYSISRNSNTLIASISRWNYHGSLYWDLEFRRNFFDREIEEFQELLGLVSNSNVSRSERH